MNAGKRMEHIWRKCAMKIPNMYYHRLSDGTATFYGGQGQTGVRFQKENPYDCFMFLEPTLYLIELKSHKGANIPHSAIRAIQSNSLAAAKDIPGVEAGFVVHFPDKQECWFADGWRVKEHIENSGRKSIPLKWFQENGIPVGLIEKRTNVEYDIAGMIADLAARRV